MPATTPQLQPTMNPVRGKGARNPACDLYGLCLDFAVAKKWSTFRCTACPRMKPEVPTGSASGVEYRTPACKNCGSRFVTTRGFCDDCYGRWYKGSPVLVEKFGLYYPSGARPTEPKKRKEGEALNTEKEVKVKVEETKECRSCGEEKPLSEYQRNHRSKDGLQPNCKDCMAVAVIAGRREKKRNTITLDISEWPEVLDALPDAAKARIRTLEHQAIAYIVRGLQRDGYGKEVKA